MTISHEEIVVAKDVASFVQSVVVTAAAVLGIMGINAWRRQIVGKRKAELAEQALSAFYEAERVIAAARMPFGLSNESVDRPKSKNESDDDARKKDAYYLPIARLERRADLFSKIDSLRWLFRAYFGEQAEEPFQHLHNTYFEVSRSAGWLLRTYDEWRHHRSHLAAERLKWEIAIGWTLPADDIDHIANRVRAAVVKIEDLCRPILMGKRG